ncbi:type III pantothenate kinase [Frateuria hangzhouensis]|uniref:type III pantothenate kinase n=1 Tax=Frateuria hangzhouensis TaxID=2995589 RepID=UPI002260EDE9|nr:type III pantothenate kinase [Frateuria sp. STR12]MCX7514582.1 type III pantothenate kinase [Frateuria sp. STR12]
MRLLLDLGNTRLKWALEDGGRWHAHGAVAWDEAPTLLGSFWDSLPAPAAAFGASVVDEARERLVAAQVRDRFGLRIDWLRTPAAACGVRNAYPEPQRLGVDRFLAMVAAHAARAGDCLLIGVGTALTLDALTADGQHLGGLIAPGPRLMQQSLFGATAQVRPRSAGVLVDVADNTSDAVVSGCWQAAAALVERFVARMQPRLCTAPAVRLDGGDAAALAPLLGLSANMVEHGVLHGLAVWAQTQSDAVARH